MEEYSVRISLPAQIDFLDLVEHLNTMPPETALQYYDRFIEQIETLRTKPESCPQAKDAQLRLRGYRTLTANDYLVLFATRGDCVEIRRVIYSKKQYEWLL